MRRASRVTIKFATAKKRRQISALLTAYRAAVNFYICVLWNEGGSLDKKRLAKLKHTRLSERYKSQALKQAIEIVKGTRKSARALGGKAKMPVFKGAAVLDGKFISIEEGRGSFDLVIRLSTLHKGHRIIIPTKRTEHLNRLLSLPDARLIQGCALDERGIILWVEASEQEPKAGRALAIDIGVNKLLSDSDGNHYGKEFKKIRDKIARRKPGSKGRRRAYRERENFINQTLNQLPWDEMGVLGAERLHDIKRGKKKNRGKRFRKAIAPWTYRQFSFKFQVRVRGRNTLNSNSKLETRNYVFVHFVGMPRLWLVRERKPQGRDISLCALRLHSRCRHCRRNEHSRSYPGDSGEHRVPQAQKAD